MRVDAIELEEVKSCVVKDLAKSLKAVIPKDKGGI